MSLENSGENDLSGASAFLGGLELAENVNAKLHIAGSNLVEAVFLQTAATTVTKTDALKKGYPFLCNDLKTMHAYEGSATYDKGQFMWQGMFYADEAGTWAFAGSYDDYLGLEIDGEAVLDTTSWNVVNLGTKELSVGWHDFRVAQYQNGGGWGCPVAGWKDVMNLGFRKSSNNSLEAKDYQRFDNHNLPMRSGPVTATNLGMVNWSSVKSYDASGLDGVVTLNAGSTLSNDQTVDVCPIWGTLKGTGSLVGRFAFAGEKNCWELAGTSNRRNLAAAAFDESEVTALAGLKKIKVVFDQKPVCGSYTVGPALGVNPSALVLEVKDGAANDYSEDFTAFVRDGCLLLKNKRLDGTILYLR